MTPPRLSPPSILLLPALSLLLAGCATTKYRTEEGSVLRQAEVSLKRGRSTRLPLQTRAGYYLDAAAQATTIFSPRPGIETEEAPKDQMARHLYNAAAAELTVLLHANGKSSGTLAIPSPAHGTPYYLQWHSPLPAHASHASHGGTLPASAHSKNGLWEPRYFTTYKPAWKVSRKGFRKWIETPGYGGPLVGVRKPEDVGQPKGLFAHDVGITAPVTAVLDFNRKGNHGVTLSLADPTIKTSARVSGIERPLSANFSAPLSYYPQVSEFWTGLAAMLYMEKFLADSGLYMLSPYDPERIPIIFVHGLASTPQMWMNVINEIEADPALRGRCQYWTFWYPTGAPAPYSALQLRQTLETVNKIYPPKHGYILISHSMGGILSRMQATSTGRAMWDQTFKAKANELYNRVPADNVIKRSLITQSDPNVRRIIFICTPHRGSELAISSLGTLFTRLISVPSSLIKGVEATIGGSIQLVLGKDVRFPTGIQSLSPRGPTLVSLQKLPIQAPHHSIIGDRGRGDTPNSSDGIVPYWSSHLDSAQSERIVPGSHSSFELPEAVDEMRRILREAARKAPHASQAR